MRIYSEPSDIIAKNEQMASALLKQLPKELHPSVSKLIEDNIDLQNKYWQATLEKIRYRSMWLLRNLEERIEIEGGMIRISSTGGIDLLEFSDELRQEINNILPRSL